MHSQPADPNRLTYLNARDETALQTLAAARLPMLTARREMIMQLLSDNESARIRVSEKTRAFWQLRKLETEAFLVVFQDADKPTAKLDDEAKTKRSIYFKQAKETWAGLREVLLQLNHEIIGPYVLGMFHWPMVRPLCTRFYVLTDVTA